MGDVIRIGVLGGTFDPVHNGHLAIAGVARERLGLNEVIFIPAGRPWMKTDTPLSPPAHRVRMLELAIAGMPGFRLSTVEIERPGPSYTVVTMSGLQASLGAGAELFFIMGWDKLNEFPGWKEPARLLDMCSLVAVPRPGCALPDLDPLEKRLPGLSRRVILLDGPHVDVSASLIRWRAARGLSIGQLVPEPVARYIRENSLYPAAGQLDQGGHVNG